jgi:DNA-binding NtrC family response regulator
VQKSAERRVLAARRGRGSVAEAIAHDNETDEVPENLRGAVAAFEKQLIGQAIKNHQGKMDAVAEALGIGRRTLNEKIVKLGLKKEELL